MFRLFVVRKKTQKSIIPSQIFFFSPLQFSFKNIWPTQILPLCIWEEEKGCFKSLLSAAAAAKISCEQSSWNGCSGEGHTDNECTNGLTYRKFRFYPQNLSIIDKIRCFSNRRSSWFCRQSLSIPSPHCRVCLGQEFVLFVTICVQLLHDL